MVKVDIGHVITLVVEFIKLMSFDMCQLNCVGPISLLEQVGIFDVGVTQSAIHEMVAIVNG